MPRWLLSPSRIIQGSNWFDSEMVTVTTHWQLLQKRMFGGRPRAPVPENLKKFTGGSTIIWRCTLESPTVNTQGIDRDECQVQVKMG